MSDERTHVLVVANRTSATEPLLHAVRNRAIAGRVSFHLLVPATPHGLHRVVDPEDNGRDEAQARLDVALELMRAITGAHVTGEVGVDDPVAAVSDALYARHADEIIISTQSRRMSRWMRLDLPSKLRGYGLPVTHIVPDVVLSDPRTERVPSYGRMPAGSVAA